MALQIHPQAQMLELWTHQHHLSLQVTEGCGLELQRIGERESLVQSQFERAVSRVQASQQRAGWWSAVERITRTAGAALCLARGGRAGVVGAAALIGLETASMTGALQRTEELASARHSAAGTAVRVGAAAASVGLSGWSLYQGLGQGGWSGALQGVLAVGAGLSAIGRGVVEHQGKTHQAAALGHEAELLQLTHAREQLQLRMEREAQFRQQLVNQWQESLECWDLPPWGMLA
jgi:hypothetical protein